MSIDVYAPCLCGSGKKMKFCCHAIASDMTRIRKLQQNHQTLQALQSLEDLEKVTLSITEAGDDEILFKKSY